MCINCNVGSLSSNHSSYCSATSVLVVELSGCHNANMVQYLALHTKMALHVVAVIDNVSS